MTARQVYEYALIEINKKQAPSLLLADYNYFINKAIGQYKNKIYNVYEVSQQRSDDLSILKTSAVLTPTISTDWATSNLWNSTYEVILPDDYWHILNCIVEYTILKKYKCYSIGDVIQQGAKRTTSDMLPQIINNHYFAPSFKNPYYYINNIENGNPITGTRMEIRYGKDHSVFQLSKVYIDYLKLSQIIDLTFDQIDSVEDTSQILEFPDYVCQEIVNELIKLLLENSSDPRLQTNIPINQTIAQSQETQRRK